MGSPFAGSKLAYLFSTVRPPISNGVVDHVTRFVGERHQPPFGLHVDVGCGTGQSTALFAPYFNSVVGIDLSIDMIALANEMNKEKNVSFRVADGTALPFEQGSTTLITCIQSAHWIPIKSLFDQCDQSLGRNGVLAVIGYTLPELSYPPKPELGPRLNRVVEQTYNVLQEEGCWNATRYMVDTEFADVSMPYGACKRLSSKDHEELRMRKTMCIEDFIAYLESWSAMANYKNRNGGTNDLLSFTGAQLVAQIPNSSMHTTIEVVYPWFIVMSRKEY